MPLFRNLSLLCLPACQKMLVQVDRSLGGEEAPVSCMFVHGRAESSPAGSWQFGRCEWPLGTVAAHPSSSPGKSREVGGNT